MDKKLTCFFVEGRLKKMLVFHIKKPRFKGLSYQRSKLYSSNGAAQPKTNGPHPHRKEFGQQ